MNDGSFLLIGTNRFRDTLLCKPYTVLLLSCMVPKIGTFVISDIICCLSIFGCLTNCDQFDGAEDMDFNFIMICLLVSLNIDGTTLFIYGTCIHYKYHG